MDGHVIYLQKTMIFQYIFQFLQKHHGRTNGRTYPLNAIAVSKTTIKKDESLGSSHWRLIRTPHDYPWKIRLKANSIFYMISSVHPDGLVQCFQATLTYNSSLAKDTDSDDVTPSFPWNNFDSFTEITHDFCTEPQTIPSLSTRMSCITYHVSRYHVSGATSFRYLR